MAASTAKKQAKRPRGRVPNVSLCVLYRDGREVVAAVLNPRRTDYVLESSAGPFGALGKLQDLGWNFAPIQPPDSVPAWVLNRVPKRCAVLGYCRIISAPF